MHSTDIHGETDQETIDLPRLRRRLAWILSAVVIVLILAFIPPLISVSRFQRRISSNLSNALGRPVHLDRVTLTLLPMPGFTLENFVVDDDPAFGYEPILRANEVHATVRISSLWSHHVEFSRISFTEPTSLNLVRLPDGRWNFEPVLLQASRIDAAPTAQAHSGPAPRFPYIEASGTRINLKLGQVKTPFALTESDFALWLPGPRQWHFRLEAHPVRTDTTASDAGILRLEGTLGDSGAHTTSLLEVPIDLHLDLQNAPLTGLSRIALGRDVGLRGDLTLSLHALGTVGHAALTSNLQLSRLRRTDFVPDHLVGLNAGCQATADGGFLSFSQIECHWPPADSSDSAVLIGSGAVSDVRDPSSASADLTLPALPAAVLLDWLQAATPHPPTAFVGRGDLAGTLAWHPTAPQPLTGELELSGESLRLPIPAGSTPLPLGDVILRSIPPAAPLAPRRGAAKLVAAAGAQDSTFELLPISLPLGGRQPATLEGRFNRSGYSLHLTGSVVPARLLALAGALPQFGEGIDDVLKLSSPADAATPDDTPATRVDLTASRVWGHPQTWTDNLAPARR